MVRQTVHHASGAGGCRFGDVLQIITEIAAAEDYQYRLTETLMDELEPAKYLNAQALQSVDQIREQALAAADSCFSFLQDAISSYPSGGAEFGEKLKSYAQKNIAATQEFIKQLSHAKDFREALLIQAEFAQSQINSFNEQAKNFSEAYAKAIAGAFQTPFKTSLE